MEYLRKFNESSDSKKMMIDVMLKSIKGCFSKYGCEKQIEDYLADKTDFEDYESEEEIFKYLHKLSDREIENLYLDLF
jgi:hypothetical protein